MAKKPPVNQAPAHALTALEMRIAAEFFEVCAEGYVDHGSNEFDLPDTPLRREIVLAAYAFYSQTKGSAHEELSVHRRRIDAVDYTLFHYFAVRWGALAQEVERKKVITPPLGQEELLTVGSLLELLSRNDYEEYAETSDEPDHGLPPTPEGRQLAEAAIRHTGRKDADKRIQAALAGEHGCDIHVTVLLAYLAARCRALGESSPAMGYPLDRTSLAVEPHRVSKLSKARVETNSGELPAIKRPGISPKWLPAWKKRVQWYLAENGEDGFQSFVEEIMEFANNGLRESGDSFRFGKLTTYLGQYANRTKPWIEHQAADNGRYDAHAFTVLFSGNYFATLLGNRPFVPSPNRLRLRLAFAAALGMAIGCKKEAQLMARGIIDVHRRREFGGMEFFPAAQCVLQIFASYFGEPPLELEGEAADHAIYKALAAHWRHPDADALAPLLLAVCDEHTHRTTKGKPYGTDFDFLGFERTPVEILLVFKLREELGLPNPKLDHPLMNTTLGQLHKEVKLEVDEVMAHAIKRAREQGFDEKKVLAALRPAK